MNLYSGTQDETHINVGCDESIDKRNMCFQHAKRVNIRLVKHDHETWVNSVATSWDLTLKRIL